VELLWLRRELRVLRAAMFFSLMSAFNIGFRDINFGRRLRLLTKREYDLNAAIACALPRRRDGARVAGGPR
jgi:hypothetical protein